MFHGYREKIQDFSVRDKGLYYSRKRKQKGHQHIRQLPLVPVPTGAKCRSPDGRCPCSGFAPQLSSTELEEPTALTGSGKESRSLLWMEVCLSLKVAHCKHNLEKGPGLRMFRVLRSWPTNSARAVGGQGTHGETSWYMNNNKAHGCETSRHLGQRKEDTAHRRRNKQIKWYWISQQ